MLEYVVILFCRCDGPARYLIRWLGDRCVMLCMFTAATYLACIAHHSDGSIGVWVPADGTSEVMSYRTY